MAKSWMNTLKGYFSLLNQLQIEGDVKELLAYNSDHEAVKKESDRILRGRENLIERKGRPLQCKTTIRNIQILSEKKDCVDIAVQNHLWKLYHINHQQLEQEDEQYRQITLREQGGKWTIEKDFVMGTEGVRAMGDNPNEIFEGDEEENFGVAQKGLYNRAKARRYAELWWNRYNPTYPKFEVDCTNFVSQCLHEGGLPQERTGQRAKGWWVQGKSNWSYSWSVANSFMHYLTGGKESRAELKHSADQLLVGDVICYDWDGSGNFEHNTIVVGKDPNGMPLVNAHTYNSRNRYWEYRDSPAWTTNTKYRFMHIKE